jgi:hypothetical protein
MIFILLEFVAHVLGVSLLIHKVQGVGMPQLLPHPDRFVVARRQVQA